MSQRDAREPSGDISNAELLLCCSVNSRSHCAVCFFSWAMGCKSSLRTHWDFPSSRLCLVQDNRLFSLENIPWSEFLSLLKCLTLQFARRADVFYTRPLKGQAAWDGHWLEGQWGETVVTICHAHSTSFGSHEVELIGVLTLFNSVPTDGKKFTTGAISPRC